MFKRLERPAAGETVSVTIDGDRVQVPKGESVAAATGRSVASVGQYRQRPPVRPLSLGELATLYPGERE